MPTISQLFPCLGLHFLGLCSYNPAQPTPTYFTLGDAVAALGFILAIQQLLKPIYVFRLRCYGLKISHLVSVVFLGASFSIPAMLLPNFDISHYTPFSYPVVWELAGGTLIGVAYGLAALITLNPVRLYDFNVISFTRAAAALLAGATDDDRVSLAADLLRPRNLRRLITYASAFHDAEMHAIHVELERQRDLGVQPKVVGTPPLSAFYLFGHRGELRLASVAGDLLQLLSDSDFCSALVRKAPLFTVNALDLLVRERLHVREAEPFVQELARQAILNEDSMMSKEPGYTGFGALRLLSGSLFGKWFILNRYDPLEHLEMTMPENPSKGFMDRLNIASSTMIDTAIEHEDFSTSSYLISIQTTYGDLSQQWGFARAQSRQMPAAFKLHTGISNLVTRARNGLKKLPFDRKRPLYRSSPEKSDHNLVAVIASVVCDSMLAIANDFAASDDEAWIHAIQTFLDIYPRSDSEPCGMDPLQQQLAAQLLHNLQQNMDGFYPALSRVLIAVLGPYVTSSFQHPPKRTAHVVLKDAIYRELQCLPSLFDKHPDRFRDFLPPRVTFDRTTNRLNHSFPRGTSVATDLGPLQIQPVDIFCEQNWLNHGSTSEPD